MPPCPCHCSGTQAQCTQKPTSSHLPKFNHNPSTGELDTWSTQRECIIRVTNHSLNGQDQVSGPILLHLCRRQAPDGMWTWAGDGCCRAGCPCKIIKAVGDRTVQRARMLQGQFSCTGTALALNLQRPDKFLVSF